MSSSLTELLGHFGYVLLAAMLIVEGMGIPVPGETALVTAAALAGRGTLSIAGVIASAIIGTIIGGEASYWTGRRGGTAVVRRFGRALHISDARLEQAQRFFEQHGSKAVFVGRFVAVLRSYVGFFAGIAKMDARRFSIMNAAGGALWVGVFGTLGYVFGRNLPRLIHDLGRVSLVLAFALGLVIVLFGARGWFAKTAPALVKRIDAYKGQDGTGLRHRFRMFEDRRPRGMYLTVHLAAGFVVSLTALGIFAAITEDAVEGAPLIPLDAAVAFRLHRATSATILAKLSLLTSFGAPLTIVFVTIGVAALLVWRRRWIALWTWIAAYIGSAALDAMLRLLVKRAEVPFARELIAERAIALPTGHSIGALVAYGLLAHILAGMLNRRGAKAAVVGSALVLIVAVVLGRLVLGLGYISTESASVASGMLWLATAVSGMDIARQRAASRAT